MTDLGRQETPNFEIWASALEKLLEMASAKSKVSDASSWYQKRAAQELAELEGPLFEKAAEVSSEEMRDSIIDEWHALNVVLQSGELRSGYFQGRKPPDAI